MSERRCRYCQKSFQPAKYQPGQVVCSESNCQRRRRGDYHRQKFASDPEYREVCRDSARKWRAGHPDYWKQHREKNPDIVARNREQQKIRDQKRRLCRLANNNSALDLKRSAAEVWLLGSGLQHLANNNSVPAQVWILEALPPRRGPLAESCQQHPSGASSVPAA
jgi:hypothetical protein